MLQIIATILSMILSVATFVFVSLNFGNGRKDRNTDEVKDKMLDAEEKAYKQGRLDTMLEQIINDIKKLASKFDNFTAELDDKIDTRVDAKMSEHIIKYHKGE